MLGRCAIFCLTAQSVPMTRLRKLQGEHVSNACLALLVDQVLILRNHTQSTRVQHIWNYSSAGLSLAAVLAAVCLSGLDRKHAT